jgi:hypothetical protein
MKMLAMIAGVVLGLGLAGLARAQEKGGAGTAPVPEGSGVAAKYPGDAGIEKDPAVVFVENFENGTVASIGERWGSINNKGGRPMALDADVPPGSSGKRSLQVTATLGQDSGGALYTVLQPGADQMYCRFYVKFHPEAGYVHHFVWLEAESTGAAYPNPQAGSRPAGDKRFSTGLEPKGDWNSKVPPPGEWNFYSYWQEMKIDPKMNKYWGNSFTPSPRVLIPRGKWICAEFMMKANSAPNVADGEQAFWIDGKLAGRFTGMRWRSTNDLKINKLWLEHYIGIGSGAPFQTKAYYPNGKFNRVWFDDVVVATQYIGPLAAAK